MKYDPNCKIHLSPPHVDEKELLAIKETLLSGWIAPKGPALDDFEGHLHGYYSKSVLALNSGTSSLHLALVLAGVGQGDLVVSSTFTFAACANVIRYQDATPVFIDSEKDTCNMDPFLLEQYLKSCKVLPKAIIVTHLFGMPASILKLAQIAKRYDIVLIEDAAEAMGATFQGMPLGSIGDYGVLSFNGNKIITTSGGGALLMNNQEYPRALHLATQANTDIFGYNHEEVGYNYRLSNVLASLGTIQFSKLDQFISKKRLIHRIYEKQLIDVCSFLEEPQNYYSNRWLTVAWFDKSVAVQALAEKLAMKGIETRRTWKPLHLHKAYSKYEYVGERVAEEIFDQTLCLPSGVSLTSQQQSYVSDCIKELVSEG